MMIKAGKTYPLRGGLTARIGFTDKKGNRPISGLVDVGEREDHQTWFSNGQVWSDMTSDFDIVMPKPERDTRWMNWYDNDHPYNLLFQYRSREETDKCGNAKYRTHVLEIITENGEPVDVKIHKVVR